MLTSDTISSVESPLEPFPGISAKDSNPDDELGGQQDLILITEFDEIHGPKPYWFVGEAEEDIDRLAANVLSLDYGKRSVSTRVSIG